LRSILTAKDRKKYFGLEYYLLREVALLYNLS
jgi:hypothetical protein